MNFSRKEYLALFAILGFIVICGIFLGILVISAKEGPKTLEQIYVMLFVILAILLFILVSGALIFLLTLRSQSLKKKNVLDVTPDEILRMNDKEKGELLKELTENKDRIQYLIELTKTKYYKRELDEESFRELIRDNQKKLIEIEVKINEMKDEMKRLETKK